MVVSLYLVGAVVRPRLPMELTLTVKRFKFAAVMVARIRLST